MLPVVPGPPSPLSPPTAVVRRPQHPQPVDAETECQGKIRNIEFKVLLYTQLAGINSQRLRDFDTVALKMIHAFANVNQPNAWLIFLRRNSFATREIQGSEVVAPCKILCSLHGYISVNAY